MRRSSTRKTALRLAGFVALYGFLITGDARAMPVTHWMNIFHLSDFNTAEAVGNYLLNLRVPIPPVISLLEITCQNALGTVTPITIGLYRVAMVGAFVFAILISYPSAPRLWASFLFSILLLGCTVLIHPGNAAIYDVLLPFFLLGAILALKGLSETQGSDLRALMAGITLSLGELTRPFAIVLIIPILIFGLRRLRGTSASRVALFVLPLVILSGTWHFIHLSRHGQVFWTNHSGFNIRNAWPMVESPELIREEGLYAVGPGRWANLNNKDHAKNSALLQRAVLGYIADHPLESMMHILNRILYLATGPTRIYDHVPEHWILAVYPFLTHLLILNGILFALIVGLFALEDPPRMIRVLDSPQNVLILITAMLTLIYAAGEAGEEARFLVSMLPFLACVPLPVGTASGDSPGRMSSVFPAGLKIAGTLIVSLSLTIDWIRGTGFSLGPRQVAIAFSGMLIFLFGIREDRKRRPKESLPAPSQHD